MISDGAVFFLIISLLLPVPTPGGAQRIRPPEKVTCSRDHLTSFTGKVLSMKRQRGNTRIRMRTDEETSEQFTLRYDKDDASEWFLVWGEKFARDDWNRIENEKRQLRPNLRATIWVCDSGGNPVVDWQPAKDQ